MIKYSISEISDVIEARNRSVAYPKLADGGRGAKGLPPKGVHSAVCISGHALNKRMIVIDFV